jgi:hypothetical protein
MAPFQPKRRLDEECLGTLSVRSSRVTSVATSVAGRQKLAEAVISPGGDQCPVSEFDANTRPSASPPIPDPFWLTSSAARRYKTFSGEGSWSRTWRSGPPLLLTQPTVPTAPGRAGSETSTS